MAVDYGAVIITPDAIRDGLSQIISDDITRETNAQIIWRKCWHLKVGDVHSIYPKLVHRPFFPSLVRNITSASSLVLILEGEDAHKWLIEVKGRHHVREGRMEISGLRAAYQNRSVQEWRALGLRGKRLMDRIFEFRFHTSDNLEETAVICSLCMENQEISALAAYAPILWQAVECIKREGLKKTV